MRAAGDARARAGAYVYVYFFGSTTEGRAHR
jgi:hypothetical protein